MNKSFGLLGEKLGHSYSPFIHKHLGDYDYLLYEIPPSGLNLFMKTRDFDGINITIPYKQAVIPYCVTLSDEARVTGSVNTIIKDEHGALHGYNTDHHGFRYMTELGGIDPGGKKVLVLGDGGSAKTVRAVLRELDARETVTVSRSGENNYSNIAQHYNADIIINTTPVGMYPNNGQKPLNLEGFDKIKGIADLIYNPGRTALLLEAERFGIPCINGLPMLAAQAEMGSRLFLGIPARQELVPVIINEINKITRNIVIIGMPGCGKSTVGKQLAQLTGRPFYDIDTLIETSAGKSIPWIFAEEGEAAFRSMETRILAAEAKKSGSVIATGGGAVTQPCNLDLLRQNSIIVFLQRDLNELCTEGRPLSQSQGIETIATQRLHLYEAWSDHIIKAEADPGSTAKRILEVIQ